MKLELSPQQIHGEIERILGFIRSHLLPSEKAVIGVSGGLDSDVVTRLTLKALGPDRLKLFTVCQDDMEERHLSNARQLAASVQVPLIEVDLTEFPFSFLRVLAQADPVERFRPDGLLDPSRAKCSVRTLVFSTYQDRGYVIVGTSNRTEYETGFFLPLGDGLWHIAPIIHLYKTQVRQLGRYLGTHQAVLDQPASAGFWSGQNDLEDLSYWLYHGAPIGEEIDFDEEAMTQVNEIHKYLTTESVDLALLGLAKNVDGQEISEVSGFPLSLVRQLESLRNEARRKKHRPLGKRLDNYS